MGQSPPIKPQPLRGSELGASTSSTPTPAIEEQEEETKEVRGVARANQLLSDHMISANLNAEDLGEVNHVSISNDVIDCRESEPDPFISQNSRHLICCVVLT